MKKKIMILGTLTAVSVLSVLIYASLQNNEDELLIHRIGSDLDGPGIIDLLTEWTQNGVVIQSWVNDVSANAVFSEGESISFPLDQDQMYIAVAPFLDFTHPCYDHYLSSCSGELKNREMMITLINAEGSVVEERQILTAGNGFFEIWIDRDAVYTLEIQMDGVSGSGTVSGIAGSRTCVTDIQLVQSEQGHV